MLKEKILSKRLWGFATTVVLLCVGLVTVAEFRLALILYIGAEVVPKLVPQIGNLLNGKKK